MRQVRETFSPAWSEIEHGVTWASVGTAGRGQIRLMAEEMPDGSWMWTVWNAMWPGEFQSGSVSTQDAACAAAETAAVEMAYQDRVSYRR